MFRGERLAPRWAAGACSHETVPDIGRPQRDRGVPESHPPERWHTVKFVKPVCCIPPHGCFTESGTHEDPVHWLQSNDRIINVQLVP